MTVIAITGASSGIGRNTALAFARKGASVGLIAREETALREVAKEVEAAGGRALVLPCDVAEPDGLERCAGAIEEACGPIDIWVNCAMVMVFSRFEDVSDEEYCRVTDVTYHGYVRGTRAALKRMKPRNRGQIIQVGSALSHRALPLQSSYCGAKHAIRGFTDSVRAELYHDKSAIEITAIEFPAINTPLYDWARTHFDKEPRPQAPVYDPALAAEAIVWASENPQRVIWVGWVVWAVVLGQKVFPGLLDHLAARKAWEGQMSDRPAADERHNNLFQPVAGQHADKGSYSDEAIADKPPLWTVRNQNFWVNSLGFGLILFGFLLGLLLG